MSSWESKLIHLSHVIVQGYFYVPIYSLESVDLSLQMSQLCVCHHFSGNGPIFPECRSGCHSCIWLYHNSGVIWHTGLNIQFWTCSKSFWSVTFIFLIFLNVIITPETGKSWKNRIRYMLGYISSIDIIYSHGSFYFLNGK